MKKLFLSALLLFAIVTVAVAQNISVADFYLDDHDLTALQSGTKVLDQNGEPCALIKIETKEVGFTFDVGILGVMKTVNKTGEIWVYVPYGIKRITLNHTVFEKMTYSIPINIEKGRTYIMKLIAKKPKIAKTTNTLTIHYSPVDAVVLIDGNQETGTNGVVVKELSFGEHRYMILANGYSPLEGIANITKENAKSIGVQLLPIASPVVPSTPSQPTPAPPSSPSASVTDVNGSKVFTVNGVSFTMIPVEGGTFQMGATSEQKETDSDEKPVHSVTLSNYYIGETEVTQALWEAVMGSNPSYFKGSSNPVEEVSWNDCQEFIRKLNAATGQTFRLPTEAEWEYAARGGNKSRGYQYSGSNTIDDVAWYRVNSYDKGKSSPDYGTHPVKTKQPNELGIYNMTGNVWEWCQDWYKKNYYKKSPSTDPTGPESGSSRVYRGGSWSDNAEYCRVADRAGSTPGYRINYLGLRIVLR